MSRHSGVRRLHRLTRSGAFALLALIASTVATARSPSRVDVWLSESEELARAGEFVRSETLLQSAAELCAKAKDESCLVRVYTSLGWLQGRRADAEPRSAAKSRASSVTYYQRAYRLRPDHQRVRSNLLLALHAAGDTASAVELLRSRRNPSGADLLLLGDLLRRSGDVEAARSTYFQLEAKRPDDPELHRRLLQTYRTLPGDAGRHKAWCERLWQRGMHAAAAEGLELLMAERNPYAEWSLLHWAEQRVLAGSLGKADVARTRSLVPRDGLLKEPLDQLARLLVDSDLPADSWWLQEPLRRHVAAEVLRLRGNELAAAGLVELGERALVEARSVAPPPDDYGTGALEGRATVWVDATTDLAALYLAAGNGRSFEDLEQDLFHEKSEGYVAGDLRTIHRMHTVLGVIYADRDQWQGGSYTNGIFQLRRALETSRELAERGDPTAQPLPHLRTRYADGLVATGDPDRAVSNYRQAAMDYLEQGQPAPSLEAVESVKALGRGEQVRDLEAIARTRIEVESAPENVRNLSKAHWLSESEGMDLPDSFVDQQRAVTLLELGQAAEEVREPELRRELLAKAGKILDKANSDELRGRMVRDIDRMNVKSRGDG